MTAMIMFDMLLGHLTGDYLLQNNWMALNKSKYDGLGWLTCFVHCVLYTLAVCFLMDNWLPLWVGAVFLSHFVLDKFGLPEKYLKWIHGRSLEHFVKNPANDTYSSTVALTSGFTALVYTVADNTMHLLIMRIAYYYVGGWWIHNF